jgi:hypothetical protein
VDSLPLPEEESEEAELLSLLSGVLFSLVVFSELLFSGESLFWPAFFA